MTVIEKVRELLKGFPKIADVCNEIHIDFTDPEPASYGLASVGDELLSEDILGNQKRIHTFLLYSTYSGMNNFERLKNSDALLEMSLWLDRIRDEEVTAEIDGEVYNGCITRISASNGMLYSVPQENYVEGIRYQLSIKAEYEIYI